MGLTWFAKDETDEVLGFDDLDAVETTVDETALAEAIAQARRSEVDQRRAEIARRFAA